MNLQKQLWLSVSLTLALLGLAMPLPLAAQDAEAPQSAAEAPEKPVELDVIKSSVGVWDCEFQVWAQGPNAEPMKFHGTETNRPFGEYWLASDLESTMMGQTMVVHSVIGYDLDKKTLTGFVVDYGPYAATMTGTYDPRTKTVEWTTHAKTAVGESLVQRTTMTHVSNDERVLVLKVPGRDQGEMVKFMEIRYVRRKDDPTEDSPSK